MISTTYPALKAGSGLIIRGNKTMGVRTLEKFVNNLKYFYLHC